MKAAGTIPYDPRHEAICPWCGSLNTVYVPRERWGKCYACGEAWRFPPYRRPWVPIAGIDYPKEAP